MARSVTTLTIFLSSPGELESERRIVERVVDVVNKAIRATHDVQFEIWNWKDDAIPGAGNAAQDVIDRQIPNHDVYLGLMWKRFGTPTGTAGSGTEHEFLNSLQTHKDSQMPKHVIFAFKTSIDSLVDIDPAELLKVGEFQKELQKGGILYTTFGSATELEKLLHISLTKIALSWTASQPKDDSSKPVSSEAASQNEEDADDEEELGLLDYLERSEEGMNAASEGISQIGDALSEMTGSIAERTEAMTAAKGPDGQIPVKLVRLLSNQAADDMVRFTKLATPMLDSTEGSFEEAIDAITQALTVQKAYSDAQTSEDDINDLSNTLDGFLTSIAQADQGMESMRKAVLSLPKLSARFNRARKELLAFLDGYSRMSTRLKSLTSNVLQTLRSINQP